MIERSSLGCVELHIGEAHNMLQFSLLLDILACTLKHSLDLVTSLWLYLTSYQW